MLIKHSPGIVHYHQFAECPVQGIPNTVIANLPEDIMKKKKKKEQQQQQQEEEEKKVNYFNEFLKFSYVPETQYDLCNPT